MRQGKDAAEVLKSTSEWTQCSPGSATDQVQAVADGTHQFEAIPAGAIQ